jgi:hypothetical protein
MRRFAFTTAAALALAGAATAARADGSTTKISGKVFADFSYRVNSDDGTNTAREAGTEFDLKRFYLTVDHSFSEVFGARFRSDIGDQNGRYDVFVKNAYLEAKLAPEFVVRAGAADLPWVPLVEDLYGFRYVENELVDRVKFGTSADWGLHALGKFGGGLVNYSVSVVNGRGYGNPSRSQAPTAEARLGVVPVKGLTVAVGGLAGKLGQNVIGVPTPKTATRFDAVLAWAAEDLRVGVEGFYAKNYASAIIKGTAPEDKALGASGWLSYQFLPEVTAFGRVDWVQPSKDVASDVKDLYFNVGLQYEPVKPLDLALVFKREKVDSGTLSTSNGTIGSSVATASGTYMEVGVFAQYAF